MLSSVGKIIDFFSLISNSSNTDDFCMVADPTCNPKASAFDQLGNPKRQYYYLTGRSFK